MTERLTSRRKTELRGSPPRTAAVTGMGVVSPIGIRTERFWTALLEGRCGIRPARGVDVRELKSDRAAEVLDFDFESHARASSWPVDVGRSTGLALVAAAEALEDAALDAAAYPAERISTVVGSTVGEPQVAEAMVRTWRRHGPDKIPASSFEQVVPGSIPERLALAFGFRGPSAMVLTSCASGNQAILLGLALLRAGRADAVLVGGADALSAMTFVGFNRLLSLAPDVCRPFDRMRKGLVLGEGAAFLVLETLDAARRRGRRIHAEIAGGGLGFDAYHMTTPHPEGRGGERAIRAALDDAGIGPEAVDYISAHGTGTPQNDRVETRLIKRLFGERARDIPVSSIKSMIGHTMGAASAFEAIATVLAVRRGMLPPTIHYEHPDPECDLDCVPNEARPADVRVAVSPSFAFGGNCASIVVRRSAVAEDAP